MTELAAEIERKMKEYSLLYNESETLRRLARCRAQKMSREEALNWLGVLYELLKRYDTLVQEQEALEGILSGNRGLTRRPDGGHLLPVDPEKPNVRQFGFEEAGRVPFDPAQALANWNIKKRVAPDVVLGNGTAIRKVAKKLL